MNIRNRLFALRDELARKIGHMRRESDKRPDDSVAMNEADLVTFVLGKGLPYLINEIKKVYPETYMEGSCSSQVKTGKQALSKI